MATADSSKLEAVNHMLRSSGFLPTAQLGSGRPDALQAESILEEVDRETQARGWWYNTDRGVSLSPTVDEEIVLSQDIFRVDSAESSIKTGGTIPFDIVKRGNRVYDRENLTFTFASAILVDLVRRLEYTDIPETARVFIRSRAARTFFASNQDDPGRRKMLEDQEARAHSALVQEAAEVADYNLFKNPDAGQAFIGRRQLPR